jgi:lipopolysaccharide biosynthesis glycosyltransferase
VTALADDAPRAADPVVVACASDQHYIRPLAAMLRSVVDNFSGGRPLEFFIIQSGISQSDRERIVAGWPVNARATWIETSESEFAGLPLWGRMPVSTYYKLALPDLLPESTGRALWLDSDVIVLDDIAVLWDTDHGKLPLAAVQDPIVPRVSSACGIRNWRQLGLEPSSKYFNAGVMLIDVDAWRAERVAERAMDYLKRHHRSVTFWDQEGLNVALAGRWMVLESRWNHNASIPARRAAAELPSIAHFAGGLKPWRYPTRDQLRSLYYVYLDRTAFAGWRPEPGVAGDAIAFYEHSGLRMLLYPVENVGMRIVRRLSRRVSAR